MKTEFDVQLQPMDMFRYNLYYSYTTISGYLPIFASAAAFLAAALSWGEVTVSYTATYIVLGIVLLIYSPFLLYLRSRRQVLGSRVLKNMLHYTVNDKGITTSQGELNSTLAWNQIYRMVATRHLILVCMNPRNAFVIPRDQVGDKYDTVRQIAKEHLEPYRLKMK